MIREALPHNGLDALDLGGVASIGVDINGVGLPLGLGVSLGVGRWLGALEPLEASIDLASADSLGGNATSIDSLTRGIYRPSSLKISKFMARVESSSLGREILVA